MYNRLSIDKFLHSTIEFYLVRIVAKKLMNFEELNFPVFFELYGLWFSEIKQAR